MCPFAYKQTRDAVFFHVVFFKEERRHFFFGCSMLSNMVWRTPDVERSSPLQRTDDETSEDFDSDVEAHCMEMRAENEARQAAATDGSTNDDDVTTASTTEASPEKRKRKRAKKAPVVVSTEDVSEAVDPKAWAMEQKTLNPTGRATLWYLARIIEENRPRHTGKALADECGIAVSTLYSTLSMLEKGAFLRVVKNKDRPYILGCEKDFV